MSWLNFALRIAAGLLGAELSDEDEDEAKPSNANSETEEDDEGGSSFSDTDFVASYDFAESDDLEADMSADDQDGGDDNLEDNEAPMEHADLPMALTEFPALIPPVGQSYETDQHKKLLVVTESPYLPEGSYFEAKEWYETDQASLVASGDLTEKDLAYLNLRDNIEIGNESGEWRVGGEKSHHTYEEVNVVLKEILGAEGNVLKDEVAYDNYYARAAEYKNGLKVVELDQQPAADKFQTLWLEGNQKPDVVLIASAKSQDGMAANGLGEDVLRAHGIEPIYTNRVLSHGKESG